MDYIVRKANESDRANIAKAIALSFEKVFAVFTKDMTRMAKVFEGGIIIERYFVAEQHGEIIGIVAVGDCVSRVNSSTKEECVKNLGRIRGALAFKVINKEMMRPHEYPGTTGYIDIVGVVPKARGKGVAHELIREIVKNNTQYGEFILDVDSANTPAVKSYEKFGFVEYERKRPLKILKRGRAFMRYTVNQP